MAKSTPGQRARLYLQAHRDARMTALPGEHKAAREELMRQLEREDPGVRERALVGSDSHFDRPLEKGEKDYQRHFQREERLDHGQVLERRRALTASAAPHGGRRRPVPPRPAQHRARRAAQRTSGYVRDTAAAVAPPPVKAGGNILYGALLAGVGLSMLYLLLTRTGATVSLTNLFGGGFRRLASASTPLFGTPAPSSNSSAMNAWLATPTGASAPVAASPTAVGAATASRSSQSILSRWLYDLNNAVGGKPTATDLAGSGYALSGGKVVPATGAAAAQARALFVQNVQLGTVTLP